MTRAILIIIGALAAVALALTLVISAHTYEDGSGALWQSQTGEHAVSWCLPWGDCQIQ